MKIELAANPKYQAAEMYEGKNTNKTDQYCPPNDPPAGSLLSCGSAGRGAGPEGCQKDSCTSVGSPPPPSQPERSLGTRSPGLADAQVGLRGKRKEVKLQSIFIYHWKTRETQ